MTINVRTIVDIGNTNILFGNIVKGELISQMRIETSVIVNAQKDNISTDLVELKNFLSDSNARAFCAEGAERIFFQKLHPETAKNSLCEIAFFFTKHSFFRLRAKFSKNGG